MREYIYHLCKKVYRYFIRKIRRISKKEYKKVEGRIGKKVPAYHTDEKIGDNIYLYWWRDTGDVNLGDYLSSVVVNAFAPKKNGGSPREITLFSVGSVLGYRLQDGVVWGSGFLNDNEKCKARVRYSNLDVRAVRGPLSRKILLREKTECPSVYGDPALLMPLIYNPSCTEKKYQYSVIYHYSGKISIPENLESVNVINIQTNDYMHVIDEIVSSEKVISSSLHGIILAEAYGIPAVLLLDRTKSTFKYKDYYYGTGRKHLKIAHSFNEAIKMKTKPLTNLEIIQKSLINSFPYDLWSS